MNTGWGIREQGTEEDVGLRGTRQQGNVEERKVRNFWIFHSSLNIYRLIK
jgi:hypothetical protein